MSAKDPVVVVDSLSKGFRIPQREHMTLRGRILHPFAKPEYLEFQALQNVSFEVEEGEFFGIIGRNGSGKSTLLKLIAGIYRPDSGRSIVNGSIASFIELGVGFNMDLTGRDNLHINGTLLGMSRKEIRYRYDSIVEFAELEDFMDLKLRNYSSGMQVRLAFSVALQADADVLLTDEVLAVGDARFQEKCYEIFQERKRRGRTIIFVSHDMGAIQQFCDRVMLMEKGVEVDSGPAPLMARSYLQLNALGGGRWGDDPDAEDDDPIDDDAHDGDGAVRIVGAWCETSNRGRTNHVAHGETVRVCVQIEALREQRAPVVAFAIRDNMGQVLLGSTTTEDPRARVAAMDAGDQAVVGFEFDNQLADGGFTLDATVSSLVEAGVVGPALDTKRSIWKLASTGVPNAVGVISPPVNAASRVLEETDAVQGAETTVPGTEPILLLSALGNAHGLFELRPLTGRPRYVDRHPSAGVAIDGDRVVRVVRNPTGTALLEYDTDGMRRFLRLPDVDEASDLVLDGDDALIVATGSNRIVRVRPDGSTTAEWQMPGAVGDAWHLTSVARNGDDLLVTAFGRYPSHREWLSRVGEPDGLAFRTADGTAFAAGLVSPQSLRPFGDGWLLCEASTGTLIELDAEGTEVRRVALGGWLRGIAMDDEHVYVGSSGERTPPDPPTRDAELVVLDRSTFEVLRRVPVPTQELANVTLANEAVLAALRAPVPVDELGEELSAMRLATGGLGRFLEPSELRSSIDADLATLDWNEITAGHVVAHVENLAPVPFATMLPHPVQLAYRWIDTDGSMLGEGRQSLPGVVKPGERVAVTIEITKPDHEGDADLVLSLVQEGVAWFVDIDGSNGCSMTFQLNARTQREIPR